MTAPVENGSKVRVTFDAYVDSNQGNSTTEIFVKPNGDGKPAGAVFPVPKGAEVRVLEKPLPPEPPVGTVLLIGGRVYTRTASLNGRWLTDSGVTWTWADTMGRMVRDAKSVVNLTEQAENSVDLSDVEPYEAPIGYNWTGTDKRTAVNYILCDAVNGPREISVFLPDRGEHIRFKHGEQVFCLGADVAADIAKRILKTFEEEF